MKFSKALRALAALLFVAVLISNLSSCDSDDDMPVFVYGTVIYVEDFSPAIGVPVQMQLYEDHLKLNVDGTSNAKLFTAVTDEDGRYIFTIDSKDIPNNPYFSVRTNTDTLLDVSPGFSSCLTFLGFPAQLKVDGNQHDLYVDHPTFLQITFDKIDHESPEYIRYTIDCIINIETSAARPDTTILERKAFAAVENIHTRNYYILKADGEEIVQTLEDISWIKGDTAKVTVAY